MGRWGNELYRNFLPHPLPLPTDTIFVATYTAVVDVDIISVKLRFNEALHPDAILRALLVDNWGSISLPHWPPDGCTDRNRFRFMALRKVMIFLYMAEQIQFLGKPERPPAPEQPEPVTWPRTWAYVRFPAAHAAREIGGGPYRSCTFEARVRTDGYVVHDYCIADQGMILPGLERDLDTLGFVRALVQTDLRQRIEALIKEHED